MLGPPGGEQPRVRRSTVCEVGARSTRRLDALAQPVARRPRRRGAPRGRMEGPAIDARRRRAASSAAVALGEVQADDAPERLVDRRAARHVGAVARRAERRLLRGACPARSLVEPQRAAALDVAHPLRVPRGWSKIARPLAIGPRRERGDLLGSGRTITCSASDPPSSTAAERRAAPEPSRRRRRPARAAASRRSSSSSAELDLDARRPRRRRRRTDGRASPRTRRPIFVRTSTISPS